MGSRRPKIVPVCVIRKRSLLVYSRPSKSSKSAPWSISSTGPRAESARISSTAAGATQTTASAYRATSRATYFSPADVLPPVRVRDQGVAQVGDPADARGPLHRSAEKVHRPRRRRGDDDVDPVVADEPDRSRYRGQEQGRARVGNEEAPRGQGRVQAETRDSVGLGSARSGAGGRAAPGSGSRGRSPPAGGPGSRPVHPLRVRGHQDVRLDAELGQVRRHLQRPRRAAAAHGRPVHRREEDLHEPSIRKRV